MINGLTDLLHPCQILADLLTVRQQLGTYEGKKIAWIGDGNNMANSWINAAYRFGFELELACPEGYEPDAAIARARAGRREGDASCAIRRRRRGARTSSTPTCGRRWGRRRSRRSASARSQGYAVDAKLMSHANKDAIFLHCLPAHRGEEVAAEVIDGPQSRVWDEAENRLHIQKAIMAVLMGGEPLA